MTAIERLEKELSQRVVVFKYRKSDGSVRQAVGTTLQALIPAFTSKKEVLAKQIIEVAKDAILGYDEFIESADTAPLHSSLRKLSELLDEMCPKKMSGREVPPDSLLYYDFTSKGWRSFKKDCLIQD